MMNKWYKVADVIVRSDKTSKSWQSHHVVQKINKQNKE